MDKKGPKWTAVDTLFWGGGALITGAVALSHFAAGMAVAGLFCLVGAWLIDHSGGGDKG